MKRIKHTKIKNTGILYELLTRQVSADVVGGVKNSKALAIIKEFFLTPSTQVAKELLLYSMLMSRKFNSETKANTLIEAVLTERKKLDVNALRKEKYRLIRRIMESYDVKSFFGSSVPHYTEYASVFRLFESATTTTPYSPEDVAQSRVTLLEHISGKPARTERTKNNVLRLFESQSEDVRLLTTKLLVDKFNEQYASLLPEQRNLLREFINDSNGSLRKHMEHEIPKVTTELTTLTKKVPDKVTRIKLTEVMKQLGGLIKGRDIKDNSVFALLEYYSLIRELKSLEKR